MQTGPFYAKNALENYYACFFAGIGQTLNFY